MSFALSILISGQARSYQNTTATLSNFILRPNNVTTQVIFSSWTARGCKPNTWAREGAGTFDTAQVTPALVAAAYPKLAATSLLRDLPSSFTAKDSGYFMLGAGHDMMMRMEAQWFLYHIADGLSQGLTAQEAPQVGAALVRARARAAHSAAVSNDPLVVVRTRPDLAYLDNATLRFSNKNGRMHAELRYWSWVQPCAPPKAPSHHKKDDKKKTDYADLQESKRAPCTPGSLVDVYWYERSAKATTENHVLQWEMGATDVFIPESPFHDEIHDAFAFGLAAPMRRYAAIYEALVNGAVEPGRTRHEIFMPLTPRRVIRCTPQYLP